MRFAAAVCVCVVSHSALGQSPQPRELAAVSGVQDESAVFETTLAVGEERVISVFHVIADLDPYVGQIGYAIATFDPNSGDWAWTEEGVIDPNGLSDLGDPSVAYDSVTGDFLACALTITGATRSLVLARYDSDSGQFGSWEEIRGGLSTSDDKPWIVRGEVFPGQPAGLGPMGPGQDPTPDYQEFYIAWRGAPAFLNYLRSMDGGQSWVGGEALTDLDNPNSRIVVDQWPAPRVYDSRALYVAYFDRDPNSDSDVIEIVRGNDVNSGGHAGEVEFTQLLSDDPGNPTLAIFRNRKVRPPLIDQIVDRVPGGSRTDPNAAIPGTIGEGMDFAVDPTDAARLYVVYTDTATPAGSDTDLNIYLRVLERVQGAIWSVGDPILVNNDETQHESDQFMPAIKVDEGGGIHVIFYDDRKYNTVATGDQVDGSSTSEPKFDVWYAFSEDQGDSWDNLELCDDPENDCEGTEEALSYGDFASGPGTFLLRDYIGIDIRDGRVWTAFMGASDEQDPNPHESVIWSSQIVLP